MAKKSKGGSRKVVAGAEKVEIKPRKVLLRTIEEGKPKKDDQREKKDTGETLGQGQANQDIDLLLQESGAYEMEDRQKIRALLKDRKARVLERQQKNIEDPAATMPEDLPKVKHRSRTKEGYYIYTPDELKMGLPGSGMTDKCPFDCDCCF